jgi:uncharacterized repeat protein (TIGR03847 family)
MSMAFDYDLDRVSFITVGAQGPPGARTFFLQAAQGSRVVSLLIEKEQAAALAEALARLLDTLAEDDPEHAANLAPDETNMALLAPLDPAFRVVQLGVGVDEDDHVIVLVAQEGDDEEPGQRARFVASYAQMLALAQHADEVVNQGRPVCPLCGGPIDAEGHFCPRRNGHHTIDVEPDG